MANITINEISRTYNYAVGTNTFATVALPITAAWGPGYTDPSATYSECDPSHGQDPLGQLDFEKHSEMIDRTAWNRFASNQSGLDAFTATYRGPIANYRMYNDYSYQMAVTLLLAGYDVLVCRISPGAIASCDFTSEKNADSHVVVSAKYPGDFGNQLRVEFRNISRKVYNPSGESTTQHSWNMIVYVVNPSGTSKAVENKTFVFDINNTTDSIPHWREIESDFVTFKVTGSITDADNNLKTADGKTSGMLTGGNDLGTDSEDAKALLESAAYWANLRFPDGNALNTGFTYTPAEKNYVKAIQDMATANVTDLAKARAIWFREWVFSHLVGFMDEDGNQIGVFDILKDKLAYSPNRIMSAGWDDQDFLFLDDKDDPAMICDPNHKIFATSPIHRKIMDVAYFSRCATGFIDIPRSLDKAKVYGDGDSFEDFGYAQKLARYIPDNAALATDSELYHTHSALFTCWGKYIYSGIVRQTIAPPSFLALMIQRAMVLNQALQYEWILPSDRKQNLNIGKLDYTIPQKLLNVWQSTEGVGVNCITPIPGLGTTLWGNSTLFEVPPASYQALANLSTRYLVNAVEDVVYRTGISITFQYSNGDAYSSFVAGCLPILDTMRNAGAIEDYRIQMSADIDVEGTVKANSVLGKILLVVNGVVNDITVDLIALPPNTDLSAFAS